MQKQFYLILFLFFQSFYTLSYAEEDQNHLTKSIPVEDQSHLAKGSSINKSSNVLNYEEGVRQTLNNLTREQIDRITKAANSTNSGNEKNIKGTVLSAHIKSFKDIPKEVDEEIEAIQKSTRNLIRIIATDIEISKGSSGSLEADKNGNIYYKKNKNLPEKINEKQGALLKAHLKNSVSVRSVILAIKLLSKTNEELKQAAYQEKNKKRLAKIYIKQAIYVYEMSDIVLSLLNDVSLEGKSTIEKLHDDAQKRVQSRTKEIELHIEKAKKLMVDELISEKEFKAEEEGLIFMKKANEQSLKAWDKMMKELGNQQNFIDNLKKKRDLISYKQEKAKLQIDTLRDMNTLSQFKELIGNLDNLVDIVGNIDLLVLDEKTVRKLIGYEIDE